MRASALLPRARATDLLVRIVRRNAPADPGACSDLLRRCVAADSGSDLAQIAAALIDVLPGDPARRVQPDNWSRRGSRNTGLGRRYPGGIKPDQCWARSACRSRTCWLGRRHSSRTVSWSRPRWPSSSGTESTVWPAVARLREASLDHLRKRIALPLEAPRDWVRANPLKCTCADCRALGAFLAIPDQRQWRLRAAMGRRAHVEQNVRNAPCDLDLTTEKRGSPHTLVATKNQASQRRAKQRRRDLEHVSALGG